MIPPIPLAQIPPEVDRPAKAENPYRPPAQATTSDVNTVSSLATTRVRRPAWSLIVVGVLNMLYAVLNLFAHLVPAEGGPAPVPRELRDDVIMSEVWKEMQQPDPLGGSIASIVLFSVAGVISWGGISMLRLRNYGLSVTSSVLSMMPCLTILGCCGAGQVVGIWALTVLVNPNVRSEFP